MHKQITFMQTLKINNGITSTYVLYKTNKQLQGGWLVAWQCLPLFYFYLDVIMATKVKIQHIIPTKTRFNSS